MKQLIFDARIGFFLCILLELSTLMMRIVVFVPADSESYSRVILGFVGEKYGVCILSAFQPTISSTEMRRSRPIPLANKPV